MGEKDFQQLHLVKNYLKRKSNTKIISCKTIRDSRKLALSSRNLHLTKKDLNTARMISMSLIDFKKLIQNKNKEELILLKKKN